MPPTHFATLRGTGVWLKKLASQGAKDASRAHQWISPMRRLARPQAALVVMREELGLVGRHVDVDGAIALAAFAGQAEIEGFA